MGRLVLIRGGAGVNQDRRGNAACGLRFFA